MSLTLGDIITAARDRNAQFHKSRIPSAVVARYLTGYQRRLISKASEFNAEAFAQQASIAFDVTPENAVGVVGAGTAGGLPAGVVAGAPVLEELPAGAALEVDFDGAAILYPATVVSSATATTLTRTAAGWTVDQWAGKYAWISDGPGISQRRLILSNTATVLTLSQAWVAIPTGGVSLFEIVNPPVELSQEVGVITALPPESERIGYLVRLNAQGVPYIDLTKPLVAKYGVGIDLPPHELLIGGDVRLQNGGDVLDLSIYRYHQRWAFGQNIYSCYEMSGKLFLIGGVEIWGDVAAIDLRYVPIAPALTALTDLLLLSDNAYDALVARSAELMANRVNSLPDQPKVDVGPYTTEAEEAEGAFFSGVGRLARSFPRYRRSVW